MTPTQVERIADPYRRIEVARDEMDARKEQIAELGRIRSAAVRQLLDSGAKRDEIAERLGVHPQYVYELARDPSNRPRKNRA